MSTTNNKLRIGIMCVFSFLLFSCDKDVSDVGGDILTNTNIVTAEFNNSTIETENISLDTIQSNNLGTEGYLLGTSSESSGTVNYSMLFRVERTTSPIFARILEDTITSVKIESANLIIPYTYTDSTAAGSNTERTYQISGIINEGQPLKVDVFRSEHNLELTSSLINSSQLYYSNAFDGFRSFKENIQIESNKVLKEIIDNKPDSTKFQIATVDTTASPVEPFNDIAISDAFEDAGKTLRISLNKDFFGGNIVDADGIVTDRSILFNTNTFLDKFKGVYVKPTAENTGLVRVYNRSVSQVEAKIEITFEITSTVQEVKDSNGNITTAAGTKTEKEVVDFNMNNQIVNILDASKEASFNTAFRGQTTATLKGGVSATRIELFQDTNELTSFFEQNPIINQATLKFFVNKESPLFNEGSLPENLIINGLMSGAEISLGALIKDEEKNEFYYEFNVTSYLKGIFNQVDSEAALNANVELVVGVTEVATAGRSSLRIFGSQAKRISIGSLQSVKEVFLYGSEAVVGKRPQLTIKYTQTK